MGPHDFTPVGAPPRNWFARNKALTVVLGVVALLFLLLIIPAGSSGTGTGAAPTTPPSVYTQQNAPQPQASTGPCTTNACIAQELDQSLVGGIDQGDAVATKVTCQPSTVKDEGNGNWDARCTVRYSDHTTATGYGTVDTEQGKVLFAPDSP